MIKTYRGFIQDEAKKLSFGGFARSEVIHRLKRVNLILTRSVIFKLNKLKVFFFAVGI